MKDGGRMIFLPDILSRLLAVVIFSQPTIWVMSGQEATCQSAAEIGPRQFSCYQ